MTRNAGPLLLAGALLSACTPTTPEVSPASHTSRLWGASGELWSPSSRLPDFSWAGYRGGEPPPRLPVTANVRDFGARGDGVTDDSHAFVQALAAAGEGAVLVPAGRYRITQVLRLERSRLVLRGAGPEVTTLVFPLPLSQVAAGEYGGPHGWAWGGGWIWARGEMPADEVLAAIVEPARRGDRRLAVSTTVGLYAGQVVRLVQRESDGTLTLLLHNGQTLNGRCWVDRPGEPVIDWAVEIRQVEPGHIELQRPLRIDVRPEWKPELVAYRPSVVDVGVESLTVEFPITDYPGHHLEPGLNAVFFQSVHDGWVRDVRIRNFDNGVTLWLARHISVEDVVLEGRGGHYGFNLLAAQDCLVTRFAIRTRSLHDLSVSNLANGNVFSRGEGIDVNFDHHRGAPYENLFSDIDVGSAWRTRRLWESSGTPSGHYAAARETFWNIRPRVSSRWLPAWPQLNVIGRVRLRDVVRSRPLDDLHLEPVSGLEPADLHAAQRRLRSATEPRTIP